MAMRKFEVTLTGIAPILFHHDDIEWADQLSEVRKELKKKDKENSKAGDDRSPPESWKGSIYRDVNNEFVCIPTDNIMSAIKAGGSLVPFGRQSNYKRLTQSGICPDTIDAQFFYNKNQQLRVSDVDSIKGKFADHLVQVRELGFNLLVKRARVNQSKHVRVRPMFRNWVVIFNCTVVDDQITDEVFGEILILAGRRIGLLDWRPGSPKSPGPYGTFGVTIRKI